VRKKWLLLLCLLVAAFGGVALWLWSTQRSEPMPSLLLPNSNRVHLVAVTVGTNDKINFGKPTERVLARLPGKLGKRFRANEISAGSPMAPGSHIILWFRYDRPAEKGAFLRASLVQKDGSRYAPVYAFHPRTLPNGVTVGLSGTHLWPRRNRTLTFRIEQGSPTDHQGVPVGELTVANPAFGKYPVWEPEELPATRNFKNASFTLETVSQHQARVRAASDGKPDMGWEVWGHWLRDATGNLMTQPDNQMRAPTRYEASERGVITVPILSYGMPKERAWKLGLQFVRAGHFASNEVFVLRGVPATATASWPPVTWKTNLPVGTVQLSFQLDWDDGSRRPCLITYLPQIGDFAGSKRSSLAFTILEAVDATGRRIPVVDGRKIHIPTGSTTLDITIGVPAHYFVEYTVDANAVFTTDAMVRPSSAPAFMKTPKSVPPEKIRREMNK